MGSWSVWSSLFGAPAQPKPSGSTAKDLSALLKRAGKAGKNISALTFFELEHRVGSVGSVSPFCVSVEAHLRATVGREGFETAVAFKDKMPKLMKAPAVQVSFRDSGEDVEVVESDAICKFLLAAFPGSDLIRDDDEVASGRRRRVHLLKRLATDRLYFVGYFAATQTAGGMGGSGSGPPWPFSVLFARFLRKQAVDQCRAAAGGLGRRPLEEVLEETVADLRVVEEEVKELSSESGFLSGLRAPSSAEVAMWAQMVPTVYDGKDTELGRLVRKECPVTCEWLKRVSAVLFPDRVAGLKED